MRARIFTTNGKTAVPPEANVSEFIARWETSGAAERANYQLFLSDLCDVLGVPKPEPAKADPSLNSYVFEHPVLFDDGFGHTTTKFIDLYKRGLFILEAKQGSDKEAREDETGLKVTRRARRGTAVRGTQGWDDAMLAAKGQAELYAKSLPVADGWPPFLIIVDVGHSIELFADFSRSGKTYVAFPDALTHRIPLKDVAKDDIRDRLQLVWTDPLSLDPSKRSAKVTREVAEQLAELAKSLERSGQKAEIVAQFLMRCIFTMFAEDVGLLPKDSFTTLLEGRRGKLATFPDMLASLWATMDKGGFSPILDMKVLQFNGQLFADSTALPLSDAQLELLIKAAKSDWKAVEPAIFGTLLERALDPIERHKLGAHYTPRAYVERLVIPTIVEPLREEWSAVQTAAVTLAKAKKLEEARDEVREFLKKVCSVTVLDPACGSGNFLYVTLEHLKRLEGEIRDALRGFGEKQEVFEGVGLTVDPHQLLGVELNPRAAAIAELVLWIGYLQWHFRTFGNRMPAEPVIKAFRNIECRDAVLAYDRTEPVLDDAKIPITRWDGRTTKSHPVTREEVPDETAQIPLLRYINPKKTEWPKADFIVGNPPYIGARRIRLSLGDDYVETLRRVYPDVPETCDLVMYWWHKAASMVGERKARRFGFITTNSIVQSYSRILIERHLESDTGVSLVFAIPDHPWVEASDGAAVRVAMTVATPKNDQNSQAILQKVVEESEDTEQVVLQEERAQVISSSLSGSFGTREINPLKSNEGMCFQGVVPAGDGFKLTLEELERFNYRENCLPSVVRNYIIGRDLVQRPHKKFIIDFFGLSEHDARTNWPHLFQHILDRVHPERIHNNRATYRDRWWIFAEPRPAMRNALAGLKRFIATPYTAKHRPFIFVDPETLPDAMAYAIASDDAFILGVLSSRIHVLWAVTAGGRLGVGNDPRYTSKATFVPFAFPDCSSELKTQIRKAAEALDGHRKRQLSQHPTLTITDTYNVLEKLRVGEALSEKERLTHEQGLVSVLKQIHDDLDTAVFAAYGWPNSLSDDEILTRLVALNAERAAKESQGNVHWLRPEFQNPTGHKAATQATLIDEPSGAEEKASPKAKLPWPKTLPERAQAVKAALASQRSPVTPEQLAKTFLRARVDGVEELLETLASLGQARELDDGRFVAPAVNRS